MSEYSHRLLMEYLIQHMREIFSDLPDNPLDISQWLPEEEE